jgi:putative spermidine/putrescine transport system permease protein
VLDWSLRRVGLSQVHLIYTNWAVFTVFCYIWLPFMIIPVYAALDRIPNSQIEASQDLGARTWRTLRSVVLPLALPGVLVGATLVFAGAVTAFTTPQLLGGSRNRTLATLLYNYANVKLDWGGASAVALIMTALVLAAGWASGKISAKVATS